MTMVIDAHTAAPYVHAMSPDPARNDGLSRMRCSTHRAGRRRALRPASYGSASPHWAEGPQKMQEMQKIRIAPTNGHRMHVSTSGQELQKMHKILPGQEGAVACPRDSLSKAPSWAAPRLSKRRKVVVTTVAVLATAGSTGRGTNASANQGLGRAAQCL